MSRGRMSTDGRPVSRATSKDWQLAAEHLAWCMARDLHEAIVMLTPASRHDDGQDSVTYRNCINAALRSAIAELHPSADIDALIAEQRARWAELDDRYRGRVPA
ncbi:MAG: hypothetical protein ACYC28_15480 [Longimicrobiales bacterium]